MQSCLHLFDADNSNCRMKMFNENAQRCSFKGNLPSRHAFMQIIVVMQT